jgi:ribonuclease HII
MRYIIGMDEAGLAPNLGPLVIVGTVWRTQHDLKAQDMFAALESCVSQERADQHRKLWVTDSKLVYQSGQGLAALERVALIGAKLIGCPTTDWHALLTQLTAQSDAGEQDLPPWHGDFNFALPCENAPESLQDTFARTQQGLYQAGAELVAVAAEVVFPSHFNRLVIRTDNKAAAVSELSLRLLARLLEKCDGGPIEVVCDRHGGRARYAAMLQQQFIEDLVQVVRESDRESKYRWGDVGRNISVSFRVSGEEIFPVAWAAMTAKYVRELAMRAMNSFWQQHVPGLKPTAGYPVDAKRFYADIASARESLAMSDDILWRSR